jgi:DNA recombination protein RmuC
MSVYILVISIVILIIAVILFLKRGTAAGVISADELTRLKNETQLLTIQLAKAEQHALGLVAEKESITNLLKEEKNRLLDELIDERTQLAAANQSLESARAYYKSQQEKIQEQKIEVEQIRQNFQREFQNIANKLLDEKSQKFIETNRTNLDVLLNPLKENLKAFEEKVEKVYNMEAAERNTLKGVITQLMDLNKLISSEVFWKRYWSALAWLKTTNTGCRQALQGLTASAYSQTLLSICRMINTWL